MDTSDVGSDQLVQALLACGLYNREVVYTLIGGLSIDPNIYPLLLKISSNGRVQLLVNLPEVTQTCFPADRRGRFQTAEEEEAGRGWEKRHLDVLRDGVGRRQPLAENTYCVPSTSLRGDVPRYSSEREGQYCWTTVWNCRPVSTRNPRNSTAPRKISSGSINYGR